MQQSRRGLRRDDFEDGAAVGDIDEAVRTEHQAQQAALAAGVGNAGRAELGEIGSGQNKTPHLAEVEVDEQEVIAVGDWVGR